MALSAAPYRDLDRIRLDVLICKHMAVRTGDCLDISLYYCVFTNKRGPSALPTNIALRFLPKGVMHHSLY